MRGGALCIGHACWDICTYADGYPKENSKAETDLLLESGGGPAANAAWVLGHWGIPTALAALVGKDNYARQVLNDLRRAGVDCRLVQQREGWPTPVSVITVNRANGSRTIVNRKAPTAAMRLPRTHLMGTDPRLLLFDGHELQASLTALRQFPDAITVLDAGSLRAGTTALAGKVRCLVCSERFASQVTGTAGVFRKRWWCLRRLRARYGHVVVVTLGAKGCIYGDGNEEGHVPALPGEAKDTTAAGDIFHGAFAYALLQGKTLRAALELASVAAGLSVQHYGGRTSTPDLKNVLKSLPHA